MSESPDEPFDLALLSRGLEVAEHHPPPALPWLAASWREPHRFWERLWAAHAAAFAVRPKSRPAEYYDFYHDAVLRHHRSPVPALRWFVPETASWRELSYAELDRRARARAGSWRAAGVEAGQSVCVIEPPGPEWLVSLAAALALGAVVSVLPPLGEGFLARRLAALQPHHLAADLAYSLLVPAFAERLLPRTADGAGAAAAELPVHATATYATGTPVARLFSPLDREPHLPRALLADDAYLRAVRDGRLLLGLGPADALAAPDAHPLQELPALLLASLLAGATYVHLPLEAVQAEPALLRELDLRVLGVSRRLRDLLACWDGELSGCARSWFRNPAEAVDAIVWQEVAARTGLGRLPGANLLLDAASGGAVLFSPRRTRYVQLEVLPAPGVPWALRELVAGGRAPAVQGAGTAPFGLFAPQPHDPEAPPPFGGLLLVRAPDRWFYAGTAELRRFGRTYPRTEVLQALQGLLPGAQLALAVAPTGDAAQPHRFVLLVFVGPERRAAIAEQGERWAAAIRARLAHHLAPEFLPDEIEFYPLRAREQDGAIDQAWCQAQFVSGALARKSRRRTWALLAELRSALAPPLGVAPEVPAASERPAEEV
ncbi:MAG: hypothetical protein KatS3mg102_0132 [Planctomycetota bacterium]|nr:MAG: hypothetical protein KatS3mg102_0132 [Planctomycetota bacterium]